MSQHKFLGWRQPFIVTLWLALLLTVTLSSPKWVNAQSSPLPTPTAGAQAASPLSSPTPGEAPTSPLPTPMPGDAGQSVSNTVATTAAPTTLAGTALTSPGAITGIILVMFIAVGGLVWRRCRGG